MDTDFVQINFLGVTKWSYKQSAIDDREEVCEHYGEDSEFCHNEAWFIKEFSREMEEKFGITRFISDRNNHFNLHLAPEERNATFNKHRIYLLQRVELCIHGFIFSR